jgi:hypothetical protein
MLIYWGKNVSITYRNKGCLQGAWTEVNTKETMNSYIFMCHHQNIGRSHTIRKTNKPFENVKVKYLEMTVINQNYDHTGITSRPNSETACYHSNQNLVSSHLLYKIKTKLKFHLMFYTGVKLCHHMVRDRLRVSQDLKTYEREQTGGWKK